LFDYEIDKASISKIIKNGDSDDDIEKISILMNIFAEGKIKNE